MVERIEQRLEVADAHPVVNALSMGDVIGLIVRCAGTDMDDVPAFLDTVRERTLRAMAAVAGKLTSSSPLDNRSH